MPSEQALEVAAKILAKQAQNKAQTQNQQKNQSAQQPLTQQESQHLGLVMHLQKLIAENPQEARRALEMSQEHLPEIYLIAKNQNREHWATSVMNSDSMLSLMPLSPSQVKTMMEQTSLQSLLEMLP